MIKQPSLPFNFIFKGKKLETFFWPPHLTHKLPSTITLWHSTTYILFSNLPTANKMGTLVPLIFFCLN